MDFAAISGYVSYVIYGVLILLALWGAFCVIMAWRQVAQTRFRNEAEQDEFLKVVDELVPKGQLKELVELCHDDPRALPQLTLLSIENRKQGYARIRTILTERFQRDVLAEIDYRVTWIQTVIKSSPMVGLLGTVIGMMGAFNKIGGASSDSISQAGGFSTDIMLALITTACGLAIAIPLIMAIASVRVKIGQLEDLVGSGLNRVLETIRPYVDQ